MPELECGIAAMGEAESDDIRAMVELGLPVRLTGWSRARESDVDATAAADWTRSTLRFRPRRFNWARSARRRAGRCRSCRELLAMRASALHGSRLERRMRRARRRNFCRSSSARPTSLGAHRIRLADTVGIWNPLQTASAILSLREFAGEAVLEFHGHNDLGMATANAIAAIQSGAGSISATVTGIGERAGNAALEQVAMAMRHSLGRPCGIDCRDLQSLCELVARAAGRAIPVSQPITGEAIFQHESGIHCHSLIQGPAELSSCFRRRSWGERHRSLSSDGTRARRACCRFCRRLGVETTRNIANRMLPEIRQRSVLKKSCAER